MKSTKITLKVTILEFVMEIFYNINIMELTLKCNENCNRITQHKPQWKYHIGDHVLT